MSSRKSFLARNHASLRGFEYGKPNQGVASLDDCNKICGSDPDCMWSTFNRTTKECWTNRAKSSEETNLGFKQPGGYARYEKKDLTGFDLKSSSVKDETECAHACNDDSNCDLYSYNVKSGLCQTKGLNQFSTGIRVDNDGFPGWFWWMIGGIVIVLILILIMVVLAHKKK